MELICTLRLQSGIVTALLLVMRLAVGFLFAFILTTAAWAQSPPSIPIPRDFFGMHVSTQSPYSTPILPPIVVGAVGKGVVTFWPYLEQSRGSYSWSALDAQVRFAVSHGNVPTFKGQADEPQWAVSDTSGCFFSFARSSTALCPAAPSDLTTSAPCEGVLAGTTTTDCQWKEFLTALVQRYKTTGVQTGCTYSNPQCNGAIQTYEGWNEPPGPNPMPMTSFITLETDFLNTVRANDPGVQVCSPAFIITQGQHSSYYSTFMTNFFANGGPTTFDCYDVHINEPTPEAQITDINTFKSILSAAGITNPLIYATEAGRWGSCDTSLTGTTEQAYIARIELLYWSNNVRRHYWYAYDGCGTLTNQRTASTLNAAGIAYGNVESWMVGSTMTGACTLSGSFWSCPLTLGNGHQALAVWYNVFQSTATAIYKPDPQYTEYHDLSGSTTPISVSLSLGESPILLETGGVRPLAPSGLTSTVD